MARIKYYSRDKVMDLIMKLLIKPNGDRRSYREMSEAKATLDLTRWSKTSKSHIGSWSQMLASPDINITEYDIFNEAKARGLIPLSMEFADFSNNRQLNYNDSNKEDLNKPIPKSNFLKELAFRCGVEIDVSLMAEKDIYDFLNAMGYSKDDLDEITNEIKKVKYKPNKVV